MPLIGQHKCAQLKSNENFGPISGYNSSVLVILLKLLLHKISIQY